MDKRYVPFTEIENFYKFLYEKRKADVLYKINNGDILNQIESSDKSCFEKIKKELEKSNRTLYEVSQDLDEMYLRAAASGEHIAIDLNK